MYKLFTVSIIVCQLKCHNPLESLRCLEDLKGEEADYFKKLCTVTYEMTINSCHVLSCGEFSDDNKPSLWSCYNWCLKYWSREHQRSYSILYLTLQEFLAAYPISNLSPGQQVDVIDKYSSSVHMRKVWKFYSELVKFERESLDTAKN